MRQLRPVSLSAELTAVPWWRPDEKSKPMRKPKPMQRRKIPNHPIKNGAEIFPRRSCFK